VKKINQILLGCLLTFGVASAAPIFTDGFEPGPGGSFTSIPAAGTVGPWTVGGAGVDWIGGYWVPANGSGSLDLAGNGPGSISYVLPTVAGGTYSVSFALAGNPDAPGIKTVGVTVGTFSGNFGFDTTATSKTAMGWVIKTLSFTASGNDALTFSAVSAGPWGPAIDDVSVSASGVPEPTTFGLMGLGLAAVALVARRKSA